MKWAKLESLWTLDPDERIFIMEKHKTSRIGIAFLLKDYQRKLFFEQSCPKVPRGLLEYLAHQVDLSLLEAKEDFDLYRSNDRTLERHRSQIREFLGMREPGLADKLDLENWLTTHLLKEGNWSLPYLKIQVKDYLKNKKCESFSASTLDRLIASALHSFEKELFQNIQKVLSIEAQASLDNLILEKEMKIEGRLYLKDLKKEVGGANLFSILESVQKLKRIQEIKLPDFQSINPKIKERYKARVMGETPSELNAHPLATRKSLLSLFSSMRSQEITDDLAELFIQVLHKIEKKASQKALKKLAADYKGIDRQKYLLKAILKILIQYPERTIKDAVYEKVPPDLLAKLLQSFEKTGLDHRHEIYQKVRASYSRHYRRLLSPLFHTLVFESKAPAYQTVLKAVEVLKKDSNSVYFKDLANIPIEGLVPDFLKDIIFEQTDDERHPQRLKRIDYEIVVLQSLREGLITKQIGIQGAHKYCRHELDLPPDYDKNKNNYYAALHQPLCPKSFTQTLKDRMKKSLALLNAQLPKNQKVNILSKMGGFISLSPLTAQEEPPRLSKIKAEVFQKWPGTSLLEILKEVDLRIGFTDLFETTAAREYMDKDILRQRLLLCLFAYGTNIGLKRMSLCSPDVTHEELRYVKRKYLTKLNLRQATTHLSNHIMRIRHQRFFGLPSTACASDSKKFGIFSQNLLIEWHTRYQGRGAMIYWHIDRKSMLVFSQLKRCSSSEVSSMIEGVLRHCTDMAVEKNYVDSHGQSSIGFAFSYLLGFDLLPRLKGIYEEKLYLPEPHTTKLYPALELILKRPINWDLVQTHYDQMIQLATALRLGTSDGESLLKRFTQTNAQDLLYKALIELGLAVKTIFLCRYLGSEDLRQEIQEGLNVVESSNNVNDFILYGKGREISSNRKEDQEMTMLCLHLLQNSLVYINTLMLQSVLTQAHWKNKLTDSDKRAITPLIFEHINPYGLFQIDLTKRMESLYG